MNKRGAKNYWISTAKIINKDLFDEYVNKVGPWLKKVGGQLFSKMQSLKGKRGHKMLIKPLFVNSLL